MYAVRNWLIAGGVLMALTTAPTESRAKEIPDSISLGSMTQYFGKAVFNHAKHIALVKDCAVCHHHTTGTLIEDPNCVRCHRNSGATTVVACQGCHSAQPFSAEAIREKADKNLYHTDKPGLKGAYHMSCLGCHEKNNGPTGCEDCHLRTTAGQELFNTGKFAPTARESGGTHGH
jgi:hypothetical protein